MLCYNKMYDEYSKLCHTCVLYRNFFNINRFSNGIWYINLADRKFFNLFPVKKEQK